MAGFEPQLSRSEAEWISFIEERFPQATEDPLARSAVFAEIDRFQEYIRETLETNTVTTVWQRLRDEGNLQASLTSFRRYVRAMLPEVLPRPEVAVWRPEVPPGAEAQIDFGHLGKWLEPTTGRRWRAWAFAAR
ncbi:hypothetical protein [Candidatus Desulforudis audaxviator]|uniref:hypothetical protein n=1 Tax=Candidatus Desulforudis audaxviator TaxID=471827 RepID=UPI0002D9DA16|nr:hypothetical protein [Candidatus Desulforudis audaxviator]